MNLERFSGHLRYAFNLLAILALSCLICACSGGGGSSSQKLKEFRAEQVIKGPDGQEMVQVVYYAPQKMRYEQDSPMGKTITIIRMDKGVMWILNPDGKTYMEMKADKNVMDARSGIVDPDTPGMKKMGKDKVEGISCTKYEMPDGGGTICIADDVQIALKFESPDGTVMFLRNIQPGGLDAGLFEIPQGRQKVSFPAMPMGALGR
jgi:hypothetical protein